MSGEISRDLGKAFRGATKKWKKEKLHAERVSRPRLTYYRTYSDRVTVRSAAFQVMQEAYEKVSSNDRYWANARQIMYAARPGIIRLTGNPSPWKNSNYFTQTLLKDYLEEQNPDWKIVWDARGHFHEPFTGETIGLGGTEIKEYLGKWTDDIDPLDSPGIQEMVGTVGPGNRFKSVMFIEKEGFQQLFEAEHIAEMFDLAIMSTKGLPVGAACELAVALSGRGVKVYCLHDFDLAGFKILKTLREGTRLFHGCEVVDLGLRLADIEGLESEEVSYKQGIDPKRYLKQCGATEEERDFLVTDRDSEGWSGQRVELNAMTSEQLIEWLKKKLSEVGVKKYIPEDDDALRFAYKRARFLCRVRDKIQEIKAEESSKEDGKVPERLREQITKVLQEHPGKSWDQTVWDIAEEAYDEDDKDSSDESNENKDSIGGDR